MFAVAFGAKALYNVDKCERSDAEIEVLRIGFGMSASTVGCHRQRPRFDGNSNQFQSRSQVILSSPQAPPSSSDFTEAATGPWSTIFYTITMFECSACTLRCLRAIAGDTLQLSTGHPLLLSRPVRRAVHSLVQTTPPTTNPPAAPTTTSVTSSHGGPYLNAAQLRHINKQENAKVQDIMETASQRAMRKALQEELKWLTDPLKFANHVEYTLRCEKPEKALELCRMASTKMDCVVAWNHCIDWHLKHGKHQDARKIFNEMKKRRQFPDSYTHSIMLRGLRPQLAVKLSQDQTDDYVTAAVSIYHSMWSPTSRVQPTIVHTNAVLRTATYASTLDAFWGIVAQIPEEGPGAADHVAYDTILEAIRQEAGKMENSEENRRHEAKNRLQAVNHGRRVWLEVIGKWREGIIKMDEDLVGSMARLLLISPRIQDWDDVLTLVEQTTNIPRQWPPIGDPDRKVGHVQDGSRWLEEADRTSESAEKDTMYTLGAKAVQPISFPPEATVNSRKSPFVTPGNEILSVVIDACSRMRTPSAAAKYWETFIDEPYNLIPDVANFRALLRLHYQNRSEFRATKMITDVLPRTDFRQMRLFYRLAVETCLRNTKSHHALPSARRIVETMEQMLGPTGYTDAKTLYHYVSLALITDDRAKILDTLEHVWDAHMPALKRGLQEPDPKSASSAQEQRAKTEEIKFLLQKMISGIDVVRGLNVGLDEEGSEVEGQGVGVGVGGVDAGAATAIEQMKTWSKRRALLTSMVGSGVDKNVPWSARETWKRRGRKDERRIVRKKRVDRAVRALEGSKPSGEEAVSPLMGAEASSVDGERARRVERRARPGSGGERGRRERGKATRTFWPMPRRDAAKRDRREE
jgi:pentatricopeptide repeat protein